MSKTLSTSSVINLFFEMKSSFFSEDFKKELIHFWFVEIDNVIDIEITVNTQTLIEQKIRIPLTLLKNVRRVIDFVSVLSKLID